MSLVSKQILKGGAQDILNKITDVSNNKTFVIIVCFILAAYSARVSQGYDLPSSLYPLFENLFVKILTFIFIIIVSQFNKSISIMLILSYVLLMISYYKQKGIEGFEDILFRFTSLKNVENFSNPEEKSEMEELKQEVKEEIREEKHRREERRERKEERRENRAESKDDVAKRLKEKFENEENKINNDGE